MKIEWLAMYDTNVKTLLGSLPEQEVIVLVDFDHFLANFGRFCGRGGGGTLWCENPCFQP